MNFIKISAVISAISLSFAVASAFAQSDVSHNNAHEESGAKAIYEQWKSNQTRESDPFYRVARGYAYDKESASFDFFENQVSSRRDNYINEELRTIEETINSRKSLRNESVQNAYNLALEGSNDEGEFDHEIYLSEMESYLEARNISSGLYYEERQSSIANVSVNTTVGLNQINNSVLNNSSQATYNLVSLMQAKMSSKRADIYSAFEDNLNDAELARAQGLAAQELASDFNDNCTACGFDEETNPPTEAPEPPPEPENPPVTRPIVERCGGPVWEDGEGWRYYECP